MRGLRSKHRRWNLDLRLSISNWRLYALSNKKASDEIEIAYCRIATLEYRRWRNSRDNSDRIYECFVKYSRKYLKNSEFVRRCIWYQRWWVRRFNIDFWSDWHENRGPDRLDSFFASVINLEVCEDVWYFDQAAIFFLSRSNESFQSSSTCSEIVISWWVSRCENLEVSFAEKLRLLESIIWSRSKSLRHESWRHDNYHWQRHLDLVDEL